MTLVAKLALKELISALPVRTRALKSYHQTIVASDVNWEWIKIIRTHASVLQANTLTSRRRSARRAEIAIAKRAMESSARYATRTMS